MAGPVTRLTRSRPLQLYSPPDTPGRKGNTKVRDATPRVKAAVIKVDEEESEVPVTPNSSRKRKRTGQQSKQKVGSDRLPHSQDELTSSEKQDAEEVSPEKVIHAPRPSHGVD